MRRRLRGLVLAAALLGVVAGSAASAPIYVSGQLKPLSCLVDEGAAQGTSCTGAPGLRDAAFLSVSPDSRTVYVAGRQSETITAFARNKVTGALTKVAGPTGCATRSSTTPGCAAAPLSRPSVSAVSPDGRFVYVSSENSDSIVVFKRDPKSGGITLASCVGASQRDPSCASVPSLETPIGITVSPDGRQLYATAWAEDAIVVFNRDAASGALTFTSCWSSYGARHPASGCGDLPGSDGMSWVTVSPDGRNVYAAARDDNAIHAFARDPATGALAWLGCVGGLASGQGKPAACSSARGLDSPQLVTVSPDGANVYATAADSHSIVIFSRNPATGALTQLAEADGCLNDIADGKEDCQRSLGLSLPLGLAFDPTGTTAYVGAFGYGSVAMYRRDPATGLLSRVSPCFAQSDPDCTVQKPMDRAGYVSVTPDGRDVLVNAPGSGAIQVFARQASPAVPRIAGSKLLVRKGRATLQLSCPKDDALGCFGDVRLRALGTSGKPVGKGVRVAFDLGPGKKIRLRPKLDGASRSALQATDADVVLVELTCLEPGGDTNVVPRWMTVRS